MNINEDILDRLDFIETDIVYIFEELSRLKKKEKLPNAEIWEMRNPGSNGELRKKNQKWEVMHDKQSVRIRNV